MPIPYITAGKPEGKTIEQELKFMRTARVLGLLPNPKHLTGERREWAEELDQLCRRIQEIDDKIHGPSGITYFPDDSSLPESLC